MFILPWWNFRLQVNNLAFFRPKLMRFDIETPYHQHHTLLFKFKCHISYPPSPSPQPLHMRLHRRRGMVVMDFDCYTGDHSLKILAILTAIKIFTPYLILVAKFLSFIVRFFLAYLVSMMESWSKNTSFLIAACKNDTKTKIRQYSLTECRLRSHRYQSNLRRKIFY